MADNDFYVNIMLWKEITETIENWFDFRNTLERVISDIKQQETLENSIGKVVSNLIEKGYDLLDKLSDLKPEEIKKASDDGLKLIERLEKSSILNNPSDTIVIAENSGLIEVEKKVIEEANKIKTRKPRAKKVK